MSVTEGCNVGCAHCGFLGSTRERDTDAEEMAGWIRQICEYGIPTIIFTGGEPFERLDVLERGVGAARTIGTPTAVFTSSYWATDPETTEAVLRRLNGLTHLYLSSDIYHQKRVPISYVHNVIDAADVLGIPEITICINYTKDEDRVSIRSQYEHYSDRLRFYEERVIPTYAIRNVTKEQDPLRGFDVHEYEPTCWIDTPIVNPNGDVFACHVGKVGAHGNFEDLPYWLGNLRRDSFAKVMDDAEHNLEYQFLRSQGPQGVAELFAEYPSLRESVKREGFTGRCDMCFSVLSTADGQQALSEYVQRPDVQERINVALLVRYGEPPVEVAAPRLP